MWIFPFANHCLQYSDYLAAHPPFWLAILVIASLALQAGADCAVFTWREKPWRRVKDVAPLSAGHLRKLRRVAWRNRRSENGSTTKGENGDGKGKGREGDGGGERRRGEGGEKEGKRDSHWWEAEGMKRKDSVWMGTESLREDVERAEREEDDEKGSIGRAVGV